MRKMPILSICLGWIFPVLFLVSLTGCVSSAPPPVVEAKPVFFPPLPQAPRFQYLTGFNGTGDFGEKLSGLDSFLGTKGGSSYRFKKPYGVAMSKGSLFVADTQSSVWRFDLVNKKVLRLQGDQGPGKLVQPTGVTVDSEGNKFVADPVRGSIVKYDKNDFYVKAYTAPEAWKPVAMQVFEGRLYVVDATHHKGGIKVFDVESGELLSSMGQTGPEEQRLQIATNLAIDSKGYLYVMDTGAFRVAKYDRDGHYRGYIGGPGDGPGFFGRPRGVAVDREGRIYVVDAAFDFVQIFASSGQVLSILGGSGTIPGTLTLPAGVCIDYDNVEYFKQYAAPGFTIEHLVVVTSQFNDAVQVSVYGYGKMAGLNYPKDSELFEERKKELEREQAKEKK